MEISKNINGKKWSFEIAKHTLKVRQRKLEGYYLLLWVKDYCVLHRTEIKFQIPYWIFIGLCRALYHVITNRRLTWLDNYIPTKPKELPLNESEWRERLFTPFFSECKCTGESMDLYKNHGGELGQWIFELPMYKFEFFGGKVLNADCQEIFFIET